MEISIGTVCYKTRGREAGKKLVITGFDREKGIAVTQGIMGKEKKVNLKHLWFTNEKIDVREFMQKVIPKKEKKQKEKKPAVKEEKKEKQKPGTPEKENKKTGKKK